MAAASSAEDASEDLKEEIELLQPDSSSTEVPEQSDESSDAEPAPSNEQMASHRSGYYGYGTKPLLNRFCMP